MAKALMVQGTGSHVGKSVIVAALCRIYKRLGYKVAPFKAQNMALNSFITRDGAEIGRAQAYQAEAAGVAPSASMNPVLLKANSDTGAQVIVKGKVVGNMGVREYHAYKEEAFRAVEECYRELSGQYDLIIIEGAGSPAEINLKQNDIVNMRTAKMAGAKVLLAADIDRGGVFASIVGTMELLDEDERGLVAGYIINKFRGDQTLLDDGLDFLKHRTGKPVLGVIPYFHDIYVQEEDGVCLTDAVRGHEIGMDDGAIDVAVVRLGHISNFTDFDPLAREDGVRVRYVRSASEMGRPDMLIIPGTKNTVSDLLALRASGLERAITGYFADGGMVAGICGGYQMMGARVLDPHGVETDLGEAEGMGLIDAETILAKDKITRQVTAKSALYDVSGTLSGYEIHMGRTTLGEGVRPMFHIFEEGGGIAHPDGASSPDGRAWGTYVHGVFENDGFRRGLLDRLRAIKGMTAQPASLDYLSLKEEGFDRLADHVERSLDMQAINSILGL